MITISNPPQFYDRESMFGKKPYKATLDRIENALHAIVSWRDTNSYDRCGEYQSRAEALIELLEIANCGSVGGFDKNQDGYGGVVFTCENGKRLPKNINRFLWLLLRYKHYYGEDADVQKWIDTIEDKI